MESIRLAVIGSNFITDKLLDAVGRVEGIYPTALYSRTKETGDAFALKHGFSSVFTDFDAFCKSDTFDAAYIATPNYIHAAQATALLQSGKHVLCEKPITANSESLDALCNAAKASGRILLEAMRPHYDPIYDIVKQSLPRLGTIRRVTLEFCQYSTRYDAFRQGVILNAFQPALCNAALLDIGVYPLHLLCMLFGTPEKIQSSGVTLHNGMDGGGTVLCTYPEFTAEVVYSKVTPAITPSVITGESGGITIDRIVQPEKVHLSLRDGTEECLLPNPPVNNMIYELEAFRDMILGIRPYEVDTELGVSKQVTAIMDQVRRQRKLVFPGESF